jgi:hypothetical protein
MPRAWRRRRRHAHTFFPMNPNLKTFTLSFNGGATFTATVDLEQVALCEANKLPGIVSFQWQGRVTANHFPQYFAWIKTVWQEVSDAAHKSVVVLICPPQFPPCALVFEPGKPCETVTLPK